MDINFQNSSEQNVKKDVQVMKVVHDLKNPVISLKQWISDYELSEPLDSFKKNCLNDIGDIEEMLENMRAEFKFKQGMKFSEVANQVTMFEFARSFITTHTQLAINNSNNIKIVLSNPLPEKAHIKRSLVKRIVDNFISNALKHTQNGDIQIKFSIHKVTNILKTYSNNKNLTQTSLSSKNLENEIPIVDQFTSANLEWLHIGCELDEMHLHQMCVEVQDNGCGIARDQLPYIFNEQVSDQHGTNWDGTGLGLNICDQLTIELDGFIKYNSMKEQATVFRLQFPIDQDKTEGEFKQEFVFNLDKNIIDQSNKDKSQKSYVSNNNVKSQKEEESITRISNNINVSNLIENEFIESQNQEQNHYKNLNLNNDLIIQNRILSTKQNESSLQISNLTEQNSTMYQPSNLSTHKCKSILVCEDNKSIMNLYIKNLSKIHIPFHEFQNGLDCIHHIRESGILNCEACDKIMILTDLNMPKMNGYELSDAIKNFKSKKLFKIILVTADEINDNRFDEIIEKPAKIDNIKKIYEEFQFNNDNEEKLVKTNI